jgi:hypothetical protein
MMNEYSVYRSTREVHEIWRGGTGRVEGFSAFEVVAFERLGVPTAYRPAVLAKVEIRFQANLVLGLPGTDGLP